MERTFARMLSRNELSVRHSKRKSRFHPSKTTFGISWGLLFNRPDTLFKIRPDNSNSIRYGFSTRYNICIFSDCDDQWIYLSSYISTLSAFLFIKYRADLLKISRGGWVGVCVRISVMTEACKRLVFKQIAYVTGFCSLKKLSSLHIMQELYVPSGVFFWPPFGSYGQKSFIE